MTSIRHSVIIVGAGASGLAAADRLLSNGVDDVTILEASEDRVGGRVFSDKLRDGGPCVELGAQWIHGEDGNVVHQFASQHGFLNPNNEGTIEDADALFILDGKCLEKDQAMSLMMILANVEEAWKEIPSESWDKFANAREFFETQIQQILEEKNLNEDKDFVELTKIYFHWYEQLQASIDGAPDLSETAIYQDTVYQDCEGDATTTIVRGQTYQELMENFGSNVIDKVKFNKRVVKIKIEDDIVHAVTEDGSEYEADVCIVTLPLGVLQAEHLNMFDPPLPSWKQKAINNMGYGIVIKIFVIFSEVLSHVVSDLKPAGFNFLRKPKDAANDSWTDCVFGMFPDQSDDHVLVAWISGHRDMMLRVEHLPNDEVLTGMTELTGEFIRPIFPTFPDPVSCRVTNWGSSPLSRGSYSYLTPGTPPDTPDLLAQPVSRILFAGEATHPHYFSTVHGAVESGWREAERAKEMLLNR